MYAKLDDEVPIGLEGVEMADGVIRGGRSGINPQIPSSTAALRSAGPSSWGCAAYSSDPCRSGFRPAREINGELDYQSLPRKLSNGCVLDASITKRGVIVRPRRHRKRKEESFLDSVTWRV